MIVQIYEISTVNEALRISGIGADHIGVVVGDGSYVNDVRPYRAKEIFLALPKDKKGTLFTIKSDLLEIKKLVKDTVPEILHLAANLEEILPTHVENIKKEFPGLEVMRTIPVIGEESVVAAMMYDGIADYLQLYTRDNWELDQKIVDTVSTRVVIAGALGPDNIEEILKVVKPYGISSKSKTDKIGSREKDLIKVKMFVDKAKSGTIEAA